MAEYSRRDFLLGVLATGTLSSVVIYMTPNGARPTSTTLQFLAGADATGGRDALVGAWQSSNNSVKIETPPVTGSTIDQRQTLIDAVKSKRADVLALDIIDIPFFQSQGLILPLEQPPGAFLEKTLIPCRLGSTNTDPQIWAAPFSSDVGMLFVRKQPSYAQIQDPALTLASVIGQPANDRSTQFIGQLSVAIEDAAEAFTVNILEQAISGNSAVLTEDGRPTSKLEVWQSALEPLQDAVRRGKVRLAADETQTTTVFNAEKLKYMRNWPAEYRSSLLARDSDAIASQVQVNELPIGILGGQGLAIASSCQEVAAAQEFINFMTSAPAQTLLASYGVVPTASAAYNDEYLRATVPYLTRVRGAVSKARLRPVHPNYSCFSRSIVTNLGPLFRTGEGLTSQFVEESLQCIS